MNSSIQTTFIQFVIPLITDISDYCAFVEVFAPLRMLRIRMNFEKIPSALYRLTPAELKLKRGARLAIIAASRGCTRCVKWLSSRYYCSNHKTELSLIATEHLYDACRCGVEGTRWILDHFDIDLDIVHKDSRWLSCQTLYDICYDKETLICLISHLSINEEKDYSTIEQACFNGDISVMQAFASRPDSNGNPFESLKTSYGFAAVDATECLASACLGEARDMINYIIDNMDILPTSFPSEPSRIYALEHLCWHDGMVDTLRWLREKWDAEYGPLNLLPVFKEACYHGTIDSMNYLYPSVTIRIDDMIDMLPNVPLKTRNWFMCMYPEIDDTIHKRRQTKLTEFYEYTLRISPKKKSQRLRIVKIDFLNT